MYNKFFGLNEHPFKLMVDPKYLFLSKSHEEAIAHLVYAVSEGEGFISLIGERGIGKTTICQTFIEGLDEKTEVAYIFNPQLSSEELLKKINTAFHIRAVPANVKELIDTLNQFLMQKRLEGKKVALFIDEAQNLKADVLEQVRLLSNLETTRDKLLQIVLVGDPQLSEMLNSYELRQIGQRVSVSYQMNPLTYEETCEYILHRLNIASVIPRVRFDRSAFKLVYKYSSGIPRKINIACDKSLLTAYSRHCHAITGNIVQAAIAEPSYKPDSRIYGLLYERRAALIAGGCCLFLLIFIAAYLPKRTGENTALDKVETKTAAIAQQALPIKFKPPNSPPESVAASLKSIKEFQTAEKSGIQPDAGPAVKQKTDSLSESEPKMTHSVQVGAFLSKEKAERHKDLLIEKEYPAHIVTVKDTRGRVWHTVRIGDYASQEIAQQHADAFSARVKMESVVRPFNQL